VCIGYGPSRHLAPVVERCAIKAERVDVDGDPDEPRDCVTFAGCAPGIDEPRHPRVDETVGGSLAAVGPDGRVRPGWPVDLKRPGAEFWSVVVGSDGTVFALAVEPQAGDTSSASILAIAPDSTVRYTTTVIEP